MAETREWLDVINRLENEGSGDKAAYFAFKIEFMKRFELVEAWNALRGDLF